MEQKVGSLGRNRPIRESGKVTIERPQWVSLEQLMVKLRVLAGPLNREREREKTEWWETAFFSVVKGDAKRDTGNVSVLLRLSPVTCAENGIRGDADQTPVEVSWSSFIPVVLGCTCQRGIFGRSSGGRRMLFAMSCLVTNQPAAGQCMVPPHCTTFLLMPLLKWALKGHTGKEQPKV